MPVDQDTQAVLDLLRTLGAPDFADLTPEAARGLSMAPPPAVPTPVGNVENRQIPGRAGDIPLRIYSPAGSTSATGALLFFHGGGWVIGSLDSHDETCRLLCSGSGLKVVSVDYRLAPETRFPGAVEDCYDATQWVASHAAALGIDASRIAVGGDSAGGNLAAGVALMARDQQGPAIAFQLLIYPVTDARFDTASYIANAEGYLLSRRAMQWFWNHYVPREEERTNPYASPLRAASLADLPPALVLTAEFDPLRDEGEAYAAALRKAGVAVQATRYDGVVHGFFGMPANVAKARAAIDQATRALRNQLGE
ncbi:MAG: alpha/beta hydrolase [Pseudomonadales bacterium]|nr:alpha/beta hydrolase [Pseudomonadales bacterium]MCP5184146.1 alpha/beta hydrolase [Pseudomonadales bacterium]